MILFGSGFGDAQGYKIGGKDVSQVLQTRAVFSDAGDYTITLKLIDRDNSDAVIAEKTFGFTAVETTSQVVPPANTPENTETQVPGNTNGTNKEERKEEVKQEMPSKLPKTGGNIYIPVVLALIVLGGGYAFYNKKK